MKKILILILIGLTTISCATKNEWKEPTSINFLVLGDWGRNGEFNQKDVAKAMSIESTKQHDNFILSMGDNFYPDGVISTNDPNWKKSYEDVYNFYSLNIPWYTVFGNHDYRGSIQAEIDYSKVSRRWRTNERYYSFEKTIPSSKEKVCFIFMDTNPFDKSLNRNTHSDLAQQDTISQKKWLEETLSKTKAKWKIVMGHHPVYTSSTRHGEPFMTQFIPMFEKYGVDVYLAGHEHNLEHQQKGSINYFISGSGSQLVPVSKSDAKFSKSEHGFMSVQLSKDIMNIQFINHRGKILYKYNITK